MRFAKVCAMLVILCFAISSVASASSVGATAPKGTQSGTKGRLAHPQDSWLYSNGPTYAETDAWTMNFGFEVSNSFNVGNATLSKAGIVDWAYFPGEMIGVDWALGSTPFSSNFGSGFSTTTDYFDFYNAYGYAIDTDQFALPNVHVSGTAYLTLWNASTYYGYPIFWDQADAYGYGAGHSTAYENAEYGGLLPLSTGCGILYPGNVGGQCSETFAVYGHPTTTPEPGSLMLLGSGLLGLGGVIRRRFAK